MLRGASRDSVQSFALEEGFVAGITSQEVAKHLDAVLGTSGPEDQVAVVHPDVGVEQALLLEAGVEHIEAVDLAPLKRIMKEY